MPEAKLFLMFIQHGVPPSPSAVKPNRRGDLAHDASNLSDELGVLRSPSDSIYFAAELKSWSIAAQASFAALPRFMVVPLWIMMPVELITTTMFSRVKLAGTSSTT